MTRPCLHGAPVEGCRACFWCAELSDAGRDYRRLWDEPEPAYPLAPRRGVCRHLGPRRDSYDCPPCAAAAGRPVSIPLHACAVHGRCTIAAEAPGLARCVGCRDHEEVPPVVTPVDAGRLIPGQAFNASLLLYRGRRLMAYRLGWGGARVKVAELGDDWQPARNHHVDWAVPGRAVAGQEDPRLFEHQGRLWVAYTDFDGGAASVGLARLPEDLPAGGTWRPDAAWVPHLEGRRGWEKNWMPFSRCGQLLAVYTITPHVVILIDGGRAEKVSTEEWSPRWSHGEMRGGAPPVLHGGEYYHWFHSRGPDDTYRASVYTFDPNPPFRPLRLAPRPLLAARPGDRHDAAGPAVVYPCGAALDGDDWVVSAGYMDTSCRLYRFGRERVERELLPL